MIKPIALQLNFIAIYFFSIATNIQLGNEEFSYITSLNMQNFCAHFSFTPKQSESDSKCGVQIIPVNVTGHLKGCNSIPRVWLEGWIIKKTSTIKLLMIFERYKSETFKIR